jgi:uncharacterized membrane protein
VAGFQQHLKTQDTASSAISTFDIKTPTQEDRVWAGLSYAGSVFCFCGLPALLIFFLKRGESAYIRFHAVQAFLFAMVWLALFVFGLWLTVTVHTSFALGFFIFLSPIVLWGFLIVQAFMGKNLSMPIIAPLISRFTSLDSRF